MLKLVTSCDMDVLAVAVVSFMDRCELALLGSSLHTLQRDLQLSPMYLGYLTLSQSIGIQLALPFWGAYVDHHPHPRGLLRPATLALGCLGVLSGLSYFFAQLLAVRFLIGCVCALINPTVGVVLSQACQQTSRGAGFGGLQVVEELGGIAGTALGVMAGAQWRTLYVAYGLLCCAVAIRFTGPAPPESPARAQPGLLPKPVAAAKVVGDMAAIFRLRTFQLVLLHGVFGSIPYNAFSFIPLWFQTGGADPARVSLYANAFAVGMLGGCVVGGCVGDWAAQRSPGHGRVAVAQLVDLVRLPLLALIFLGPTPRPAFSAACLLLLGFFVPWVSNGAVRQMMTEVVGPHLVASIVGYQLGLESIFATWGAPVVGYMAQHLYGHDFKAAARCLDGAGAAQCAAQANNYAALGRALFWSSFAPWAVCAVVISMQHCSFPSDRSRAMDRDRGEPV